MTVYGEPVIARLAVESPELWMPSIRKRMASLEFASLPNAFATRSSVAIVGIFQSHSNYSREDRAGTRRFFFAKYLEANGHNGFVYVCGIRSDQSHAWLRREALIVDITGDQFADNPIAVFVGQYWRWHAQFRFERLSAGRLSW